MNAFRGATPMLVIKPDEDIAGGMVSVIVFNLLRNEYTCCIQPTTRDLSMSSMPKFAASPTQKVKVGCANV